jgi:hypothetical protein
MLRHPSVEVFRQRYLLQWNAMVVDGVTVNGLIRFVVDALELRDVNGHPFRVHSHLLRHVGATAARHEFGLPLDVMADIVCHTRDRDGHAPEATSYYTRLPLEQRSAASSFDPRPRHSTRSGRVVVSLSAGRQLLLRRLMRGPSSSYVTRLQ